MKVFACNTVKIYKNKTQNIFKREGGGAHARRAGPGSAFVNLQSPPVASIFHQRAKDHAIKYVQINSNQRARYARG